MNLPQIKPELLNEWKKKGELLVIWRCDGCFQKIPFFKSSMHIINMIHLVWVHDHKYCWKCEKKMNGINNIKKKVKILRINRLLKRYEPPEEAWLYT